MSYFILDTLSILEASSSSEDSENLATNAIDGNPKSFFSSDPVIASNEWIQLKLENVALVSKVVITESASSLIDKTSKNDGYRLINIYVFVGNIENTKDDRNLMDTNEICDFFAGPLMKDEGIIISCKPSALEGRFVTIQKLDQSALIVGEIVVIGKEISFGGTQKGLYFVFDYL